ncbi:MAG: GIY-YIG nuclease family protein [Lewinellaceae bacterium]|nr:GIY-YIG nuclease family protein [Lewinellaceae bacterium]
MPSESYTVYILKCADKTYYVGKTKNLKERLTRHQKGHVSYTAKRLPIRLITFQVFFNEYKAVLFEKYLKSGSGRAFAKKHYY